MREIKFRAWDKAKNRWLTSYDDAYIGEDGTVYIVEESGGYHSTMYLKSVEAEVYWFTGFKDKNKVDVYEGDIIEWRTETGGVWDSLQKGEVIFNRGRFECLLPLHEMAYIEVIGNQYQ